jgi:hypothetical protein
MTKNALEETKESDKTEEAGVVSSISQYSRHTQVSCKGLHSFVFLVHTYGMKISLNWLSDFIDLTETDPMEIARRITAGIAEVDVVEMQGSLLTRLFAGFFYRLQLILKNCVTVKQ